MTLSAAVARTKDGLIELRDLPSDLSLKRRFDVLVYCTVLALLCFTFALGCWFLRLHLRLFGWRLRGQALWTDRAGG